MIKKKEHESGLWCGSIVYFLETASWTDFSKAEHSLALANVNSKSVVAEWTAFTVVFAVICRPKDFRAKILQLSKKALSTKKFLQDYNFENDGLKLLKESITLFSFLFLNWDHRS